MSARFKRLPTLLIAAALLPMLWWALPPPAGEPAKPSSSAFAIRNVRVFDGEQVLQRVTVLVRDGRIADVGERVEVPDGVETIEGQGRTLLPGLIDAHVHTWGEARRDALRFGVTSMLDMFSDPQALPAARREREAGRQSQQADLYSAGWLATASGGHGSQFGLPVPTLASAAEAAAWVAARQAEGSDFIKIVREDLHVYSHSQRLPSLDAQTAAALIDAAHRRGMKAVVHASAQQAARESLRDGADGLVHVFQDEIADADFIALARQRDAFVIPTLSVIARFAGDARPLADDVRVAGWLSPAQRESLASGRRYGEAGRALLTTAEASVRALRGAGIRILAGTDAPNPGTAHGVSMHEEIARLAAAGLGNTAALAAATSVPADAFGLNDRGRIRPGLRADLLLVEGNPLQDIDATLAIAGVWKNGQAVDRRPSGGAGIALGPGIVSEFEQAVDSRVGSGWVATSDRMAGGRSDAELDWQAGGALGSSGALRVRGRLQASGERTWGGAFFSPGPAMMQAVDASQLHDLVLHLRGDGRELAILVFSGEQGDAPVAHRVAVQDDWQELRLPLSTFAGADWQRFRALAITAQAPAGDFEFAIDGVEFR